MKDNKTKGIRSLAYEDLEVGKIYNREYIGPHIAFRKNGKETFRVVSKGETCQIVVLYYSIGRPLQHYIPSNTITFPVPENICKDYLVYRCTNPNKWFKQKLVMSLSQAICEKVIDVKDVRWLFRDTSGDFMVKDPVTYYESGYRVFELNAKPSGRYPYLKKVAFVFRTSRQLRQAVRKVFPKAYLK